MKAISIGVGLVVWAVSAVSFGFSSSPDDIHDLQKVFESGKWENWQGEYRGKRYNPPQFPNAKPPVRFILPKTGNKLILTVDLQGYPGLTACDTDSGGAEGRLLIRPCSSAKPGKIPGQITWWGPYGGTNNAGWRIAAAIKTAKAKWGDRIDEAAGIHCRGTSMGGTGCILQSMLLPDVELVKQFTEVEANLPFTDFINTQYERDPAVKAAWGKYPTYGASVPLRMELGALDNVVYKVKGGSNDDLGQVDKEFFEWCDLYKIACYGFYWAGERPHTVSGEPGVLNPHFDQKRTTPLAIFTQSSGDHDEGPRGHHNLGLGYRLVGDQIEITYNRHTNIGGGIPDQPQKIDVTVTLRPGGELGRISLESGKPKLLPLSGARERVIVYTRQPAARQRVNAEIEDASNWQHKTGVARINTGLSESDVVLENLTTGDIKVIYDCTTDEAKCVAQEARVSPDGENIAFSVGIGDYFQEVRSHEGTLLPIKEIHALKQSHIWVYNVPTGKLRQITHGNHQDRYPEWCGNDCLVFASDREGIRPMEAVFTYHEDPAKRVWPATAGRTHFSIALQIWEMDSNGQNMRNVTPHEVSALAPVVMTNGDILYSCWWGHGQRAYKKTPQNLYMICRVDSNGADGTVIKGAHGSPLLSARNLTNATGGEELTQFRALRSVREVFRRVVMDTNYYRGNHVGGMGTIWAIIYGDPRVEGTRLLSALAASPSNNAVPYQARYAPSSLVNMTPAGQDQDALTRFCEGKACGKFGYPAPLANAETDYMATWGDGNCYELTRDHQANTEAMGGRPPCHMQIVQIKGARTLLDPSKPDDPRSYALNSMTDPFDRDQMVVLSGGREWHKWDASEVATYQAFFGQAAPERKPPIEPGECYVSAANARLAELAPFYSEGGKVRPEHRCQFQGCAVDHTKFSDQMHQLAIYTVEHWRGPIDPNRMNNLGYKSIARYGHQELETDGSIRMKVPCRTPLRFVAENKMGLAIAIDETTPRLLQNGEELVCHECHGGHSEERAAEIGMSAEDAFAKTIAGKGLGVKDLVLDTNGPVTFDRIKPLVDKCNSCHTDRAEYPYSQWTWDPKRVTRPCTSDMVCKFALNSPMFQNCMPTPEHPTGATGVECLALGRWIDAGVQF